MASLKRSKTLPADGQTTKFLYTILKQLDLKSIDWNLVAQQLEITNGHAARMRFSRFRQHMEGIPTNPRGPRAKKPKTEKAAAAAAAKKQAMFANDKPDSEQQSQAHPHIKTEPGAPGQQIYHHLPPRHQNPLIKQEHQHQQQQAPVVVDPLLTQYTYPPPMGPNSHSGYYSLHPHPYPFGTVAPSDLTLQCPMPPPPPQHGYAYPNLNPSPMSAPGSAEPMVRIKSEFEQGTSGTGSGGEISSPGLVAVEAQGQRQGSPSSMAMAMTMDMEETRETVAGVVKAEPE